MRLLSWLKRRRVAAEAYAKYTAIIPTEERLQKRVEKLFAEGKMHSAEEVDSAIESLYFYAVLVDGTVFKFMRNTSMADGLLDAYIVLKLFAKERVGDE